jgi:hypothetical protein
MSDLGRHKKKSLSVEGHDHEICRKSLSRLVNTVLIAANLETLQYSKSYETTLACSPKAKVFKLNAR